MIANQEAKRAMILRVVRGLNPWQDLSSLGFQIAFDQNGGSLKQPEGVEAKAALLDLAQGFLTYRQHPKNLQEWAFVMQALDLDVDWDHPQWGQPFADALWQASFGETVFEDFYRLAETMAQSNRSVA